jgi:hypothetical protein
MGDSVDSFAPLYDRQRVFARESTILQIGV